VLHRRRGPRELALAVSPQAVTLTIGGRTVRQVPRGLEPGALDYMRMLDSIRRQRADKLFLPGGEQTRLSPQREIGELLFDAYLDGRVGEKLLRTIAHEEEVRIALLADGEFASYPWETLVPGPGEEPLVLRPGVTLFRLIRGPRPWPPTPARFTVAAVIAQPTDATVSRIDHERELGALASSLADASKFGGTELRLASSGTIEAIRESLGSACHVLHLTCHGRPGELLLEAPDGTGHPVDATTLASQVLGGPGGRPLVPFIALMGCSTAVSGTIGGSVADRETITSVAHAVMDGGAHGVLATSAVVGDRYLNLFTRHWYAALLHGQAADLAAACSAARREVEYYRRGLPEEDPDSDRLRDWSAPLLLLREGTMAVPGWPPAATAGAEFIMTGSREPRPLPARTAPVSVQDQVREEMDKLFAAGRLGEADSVATVLAATLHKDGRWDAELDVAARASRAAASPAREAYWSRRLGVLYRLRGEPAKAARELARSLWLARRTSDREELLVSHGEFGILAQDLGHLAVARRHHEMSLALSRELADRSREAVSLLQLGNIDFLQAAFASAREQYETAYRIYRDLGDEHGIAASLVQIAMTDDSTGRIDEALDGYARAIQMRATMEDRFNLGQARHQLAILLARRGLTGKALDLWRESIAAGITTGAWELAASGYHQIALTLQRQHQDPRRISEYYRRAALLEDQLGNPERAATVCFNLGQLQQEHEEYTTAEHSYASAVRLSGSTGVTAALATFQLGVLAELTHRRELAIHRCEEALRFFEQAGLTKEAAAAQCQIGVLHCRNGDVPTGTAYLLRGYGLLAASGSLPGGGPGQVARTLGDLQLARKSLGAERFTDLSIEHLGDVGASRLKALMLVKEA
jgi:tetratricopeptide (TPR) repeat protein